MSAAEQLEPRGPGHGRLWSLWEMLRSYHPIYELAQELHEKRYSYSMLGDKALVSVQKDSFGSNSKWDWSGVFRAVASCPEWIECGSERGFAQGGRTAAASIDRSKWSQFSNTT